MIFSVLFFFFFSDLHNKVNMLVGLVVVVQRNHMRIALGREERGEKKKTNVEKKRMKIIKEDEPTCI